MSIQIVDQVSSLKDMPVERDVWGASPGAHVSGPPVTKATCHRTAPRHVGANKRP